MSQHTASPPTQVSPERPDDPTSHAAAGRVSTIKKAVFVPAAVIIIAFIAFALLLPETTSGLFTYLQGTVGQTFGWYYIVLVGSFVVFSLWAGFSRFGDIRLGKDDDDGPDFSTLSWISLLFAAGMGIGLVFWGVAEPLNHFAAPRPGVDGAPNELAEHALTQSFLHWGLHAWSIYAVVGLAVAYAVHRRGRPISIRWTLEPLLGHRVMGRWGDAIDVIALVGTLFGVATSLGVGVLQISTGLETADVAEATALTQIGLIAVIMALALTSVLSGVERGMKWLSNFNLVLAGLLMLFVLFAGPTLFLLRGFIDSTGDYLQNIVGLSFSTLALEGAEGEAWQSAWTVFYWGWWMSWAPFVGIFIARVSKGRTVRQFILGVLLVPTTIGCLWFSIMGGSALYREVFGGGGLVAEDGTVDTNNALFGLLAELPGGSVLIFGAILLIAVFFITSADSAALVMSIIATGGDVHPRRWNRAFWAVLVAVVAAILLVVGEESLTSIQTAAILVALPFSVLMILMCVATYQAFREERRKFLEAQKQREHGLLTQQVSEKVHGQVERQVDERLAEYQTGQITQITPHDLPAGMPRR